MAEFKLPLPDTHCFDDDTQKDVWSYSTDLVQEILRAALDQPMKQPDGLPMVIAGALFDFAGFLTTREKLIVVGSTADAAPIADLVKEWAGLRELSLDDAAVWSWQEWVNPQQQPAVPPEKKPSPTAGMNIAQRILHVGGRNNAAGYVEFGSIQAVQALVRQVLRDIHKPRLIPDHELVTMYDECPRSDSEMLEFAHNVMGAMLNAAPEAPSQTEKKLSINDCYYCNFSGFSHCSRPDVAQAIQLDGGKPGSRCSNREVYGDRVHPIDDGDVTGFAGLLPETGWDEAPAAQSDRDAQEEPFEEWWEKHGQFCRAGGGDYEKTFAWNAWCAAAQKEQP